jgi:hypothetical protein
MDSKKLLSAKNVIVGSVVTVAAVLTSIQTIRQTVVNLFPHTPETAGIGWETVEDNRTTGQLKLDFYWQGKNEANAPRVTASRIQGARRMSGDSTLFDAGQRIGSDKWPVTLQRQKTGNAWQPVSIVLQTDRSGTTQIYIPQEEAGAPEIATRRTSPQNTPASPQKTTAPPPSPPSHRDSLVGSVQSTVEQAAMRELQRILNTNSAPQKILALEAFVRSPQFTGTVAQKQAQQELQKLVGK